MVGYFLFHRSRAVHFLLVYECRVCQMLQCRYHCHLELQDEFCFFPRGLPYHLRVAVPEVTGYGLSQTCLVDEAQVSSLCFWRAELEASLKRARIQPLVSARTILMFDDCCCRFSRPRKCGLIHMHMGPLFLRQHITTF